MAFELTKEQRWEIFNSLPEKLKDAVFSQDTADAIWNICELHNIDEMSTIAKIVGRVLMGLLPPQKVAETIRKNLPTIDESMSNTLSIEIQHYILDSVMEDITTLYIPEKVDKLNTQESKTEIKDESKDLYREKIAE
jgi:hypothetical protein